MGKGGISLQAQRHSSFTPHVIAAGQQVNGREHEREEGAGRAFRSFGDDVLPIEPPEWDVLQRRVEVRDGKFEADAAGWAGFCSHVLQAGAYRETEAGGTFCDVRQKGGQQSVIGEDCIMGIEREATDLQGG